MTSTSPHDEMIGILRAAREIDDGHFEELAEMALQIGRTPTPSVPKFRGWFRNGSFPPFVLIYPGKPEDGFFMSLFACGGILFFCIMLPLGIATQGIMGETAHDEFLAFLGSVVFGVSLLCSCVAGWRSAGYDSATKENE